jgi:hypothetical protein
MHQYVSIRCTESEKNLNSFCKGKGIENIVETGINSWYKNSRYGILERHTMVTGRSGNCDMVQIHLYTRIYFRDERDPQDPAILNHGEITGIAGRNFKSFPLAVIV